MSVLVVLVLLWWGLRGGYLSGGSLAAGILAGLVLASTPVGEPMAVAVRTTAAALGTGVQAGFAAVTK